MTTTFPRGRCLEADQSGTRERSRLSLDTTKGKSTLEDARCVRLLGRSSGIFHLVERFRAQLSQQELEPTHTAVLRVVLEHEIDHADRIQIASGKKRMQDVNLAIQFILNCGTEVAGSCHGGSHTGAYQFVHDASALKLRCSNESIEGSCGYVTDRYKCNAINTCRTCSTFYSWVVFARRWRRFQTRRSKSTGRFPGKRKELYVAAGIDADGLRSYTKGIYTDTPSYEINHIVSIVGWGVEKKTNTKYWIVRNSWGQYWGEMGFFRIVRGKKSLGIEDEVAWATPGRWTVKHDDFAIPVL